MCARPRSIWTFGKQPPLWICYIRCLIHLSRLDVSQHMSLCRHYVRELRMQMVQDDSAPLARTTTTTTVARSDIRASAEKILYTFILPGAEREILLPPYFTNSITTAIEEDGRDDPEVFDEAKNYVFQAMERDALPGFWNLSRPVFRVFRKSPLASMVNRLTLRERYVPVPIPGRSDLARISPEELLRSLDGGRAPRL